IKHLAGYVGLAPGVHQSGDNQRHTGITMRAHRLIRSYFIEVLASHTDRPCDASLLSQACRQECQEHHC
ncbi:transposase, partial [Mariniflexile gromovii]